MHAVGEFVDLALGQVDFVSLLRHRKLIILACVLVVGGAIWLWQSIPAWWANFRSRKLEAAAAPGIDAFEREDFRQALARFEEALIQFPDSPELLAWKARTLYRLDRNEDAIKVYTESIKLKKLGGTLFMRGLLLSAKGDWNRSLNDLNEAIQIGPPIASYYSTRARVLTELKKRDEALNDLNRAIELDRGNADLYMLRSNLLDSMFRFEEVVRDLDRAIELDPDNAYRWNARGNFFYGKGDFLKAARDYAAAIGRDESASVFFSNRAHSLTRLGQLDQARRDFDRALQMRPDDSHTLMGRGELRQVAGDSAGAKADFARARQLDAQNPTMWRRLGYLMVALGDVGRGLDLVAKSVAKFPDAPGYWNGLAWIRSSHPDPAARNAKQAIAAATRACELTGWSYPAFVDTLAAAFADAGRFDEAIAHQQKVVAAVPEAVRGEYEERLALYRQGQPFRKPFDLLRF